MKEINIKIKHNLTPFHSESFDNMLNSTMLAFKQFWNGKSKKTFEIEIK